MLIGLTGKAGVGKDTVADYLVQKHGFVRYAFADAVRDIALAINPWVRWISNEDWDHPFDAYDRLSDIIDVDGWDKAKREKPEVRRLLQVIGTEAGRQLLGPNVWIDIVARKWEDDGFPDAVVTDMRFPNEWEWIHSHGWPTVKVVRPNNPNAIQSTHASEAHELPCAFTILNERAYEDLYENVDTLMEYLRSPKDPIWDAIDNLL